MLQSRAQSVDEERQENIQPIFDSEDSDEEEAKEKAAAEAAAVAEEFKRTGGLVDPSLLKDDDKKKTMGGEGIFNGTHGHIQVAEVTVYNTRTK